MGDLLKNLPLSEITATAEVLDNFGITREKLHRLRADKQFMQQRAWNLLQDPEQDYELPDIKSYSLLELAEDFDYVSDNEALEQLSVTEAPLHPYLRSHFRSPRRLALLNFEASITLESAYTAIQRLSWYAPARYNEADLRDLLSLENSYPVQKYDIHLVYIDNKGKLRVHYTKTGKAGGHFLKIGFEEPVDYHPGVRFLARKS